MNSIIIDKKDNVFLKNSKIYTSNHTIPLKLIDILVLSEEVTITPKDILKITNENIPILYISKDNKKLTLSLPLIAKNSELKIMQYNALSEKTQIAKHIIKTKFLTHKESLNMFDLDIEIAQYLNNLKNAKNIDEILGIEGAFAKKYFSLYFTLFDKRLAKGHRSKQPPLDPVNAMLSFLYTISYHLITAKIYIRGFEPSISYLHTPFRSHFALSSDLLETLRADINNFVAKLFIEKILPTNDFTKKNGIYLKYTSRIKIWKHIKPFMQNLNKKVNTQIINLKKEINTL